MRDSSQNMGYTETQWECPQQHEDTLQSCLLEPLSLPSGNSIADGLTLFVGGGDDGGLGFVY